MKNISDYLKKGKSFYNIKIFDSLESTNTFLKEKAKEGVDVRIIYDDMGSHGTLTKKTKKELLDESVVIEKIVHTERWKGRIRQIIRTLENQQENRKTLYKKYLQPPYVGWAKQNIVLKCVHEKEFAMLPDKGGMNMLMVDEAIFDTDKVICQNIWGVSVDDLQYVE